MADGSFASRLREFRTAAGVPASVLSRAADCAPDFVRQVEEGLIADPGVSRATRIAEALGISVEWLATGDATKAPTAQDVELAVDRVRALAAVMKRNGTDG